MLDLPYEITEQILLKLPAKSLLRFTLVCKQWRSLISDPKFVKDHAHRVFLDQSNGHPEVYIHCITPRNNSPQNSIILQSVDYKSLNSTNFELKFQTPTIPIISGCCNGLLLVDRYDSSRCNDDSLVLLNPLFLNKHKFLPKSNFDSSYVVCFTGFGYAPSIDDYKIVRLCTQLSNDHRTNCYSKLEVEVYSLKNKSWKIIPGVSTKFAYTVYLGKTGTQVRGSIYWIIYDLQNSVIIAFDLITEKFKLLETPSWGDDHKHCKSSAYLVNVRGCLGVYRSGYYRQYPVIWIWNEDGNKKGYWTKLVTILLQDLILPRVLYFMNDNEVLLHVTRIFRPNKLVIYDSARKTFQDIPGGNVDQCPVHAVETLLSPLSC